MAVKPDFMVPKRGATRNSPTMQEASGYTLESDTALGVVYGPNLEFTGTAALAVVPELDVQTTPEENLRILLQNTPQFQAATETATSGSAAAFIAIPFDPALDDGAATAIADTAFRAGIGEDEQSRVSELGLFGAVTSGAIPLYFYQEIEDGATQEEAFITFKAKLVAVVNGMRNLDGPYLVLQSITAIEKPMRTGKEQGYAVERFVGKFTVEHGVDGQ